MSFASLGLSDALVRAVAATGYTTPTPVQQQAVPAVLEGRDLMVAAQTGTGKTAGFTLPLLQRLSEGTPAPARQVRALVLTPTRELAAQVHDSIRAYATELPLKSACIFGGVGANPQMKAIAPGLDILVACPGRLLDLVGQKAVDLSQVEILVLDEADRMLDMGFIGDVRRVAKAVPADRQTVLFSATMPKTISGLADELLTDPVRVEVTPEATTVERIDQRVLFVAKDNKRALLNELMNDDNIERAVIFTRTKHGADRVAKHLHQHGVKADAIHGNKAQNARQRALKGLRDGEIRALVATDIAARGIDVDGVTHVINFDLPVDPESYVHRIGRTARAGASGMAISFCDHDERDSLRDIERCIRQPVPVFEEHPYHASEIADLAEAPSGGKGRGGKGRGGRNGPRGGFRKSGPRPEGAGGRSGRPRRKGKGGPRRDAGIAA